MAAIISRRQLQIKKTANFVNGRSTALLWKSRETDCYDFEDIVLLQTDDLNSRSEKLRKVLKIVCVLGLEESLNNEN